MASTLQFNPVVKDSLFYNKWRYCISFMLEEVSCLKQINHEYIDTMIERRRYWREISHQRLLSNKAQRTGSKLATIVAKRMRDITDVAVLNLHQLADQLIESNVEFKLVTSVDHAWVYTNHVSLIETLSLDYELKYKTYTEAVVNRPKDTVKLKNPRHTHRSYFKILKLTPEEKHNINKFFINQTDIRLSPSVTYWLGREFYRTQDYFFIDHTGESLLVMLALIRPGLLRKTLSIIPAK